MIFYCFNLYLNPNFLLIAEVVFLGSSYVLIKQWWSLPHIYPIPEPQI